MHIFYSFCTTPSFEIPICCVCWFSWWVFFSIALQFFIASFSSERISLQKIQCVIIESTSFRRKIWPSEKCQNHFYVNLSPWNSQTMQTVKSTISYPSENIPVVKYIRKNYSHSECKLTGKVPCYLAVPMGHLCLVYPFSKMIALEELDLTQWPQSQSFFSCGLISLLSQGTHLTP